MRIAIRIHGRSIALASLALLGVMVLPIRSSTAQPLTVMSENIYMGGDPVPAFLSYLGGGAWAAAPAMTAFWSDVEATDFNERAEAIAQQIAVNKPALVALQEVMQYWTGPPDSLLPSWWPKAPADHLELDFLQILHAKLKAKGVPYVTKALTTQGEYELPGLVQGSLKDIRLVDRVAILARADLINSGMQVSNTLGGRFITKVAVPLLDGGQFALERGWNSVDVTWGNKKFRFINMCLETPVFTATQALQAVELLVGPAATPLPVILAGDSNSNGIPGGSNSYTYNLLVGWGALKDAWSQVNPGVPGTTWGNNPDLKNPAPLSYQVLGLGNFRMDLVLCRGPFQAIAAKRVGVLQAERTILTGMWPSDHAGVVATIDLK
jgi:hypothetical protein